MFKIYISADLEGVNGVINHHQTESFGDGYNYARKQQQKELNCIIDSLISAGIENITLNDAHGRMDNLILSDLNSKVQLITGKPKPISMMYGLDETYKCAIFAGYHAGAGSENAVLPHTFSQIYKNIKLNGELVGEVELNAIYAGIKKVPVVLVTGDCAVCQQAEKIVKTIKSVSVKKAISSTAAICRPEEELFEELRNKTVEAVKNINSMDLLIQNPPYKLEIDFNDIKMADIAEFLPCLMRISDTCVVYESENYEDVYKLLQFLTATVGNI